MSFLLMRNGIN